LCSIFRLKETLFLLSPIDTLPRLGWCSFNLRYHFQFRRKTPRGCLNCDSLTIILVDLIVEINTQSWSSFNQTNQGSDKGPENCSANLGVPGAFEPSRMSEL
jgi:hypothetical protein